jgi:hypothetical protein
MYQIFTLLYIFLLGAKVYLLSSFKVLELGQRAADVAIVCGPALCLLLEFYCFTDAEVKREQYRTPVQLFDMILQLLFVSKVVLSCCRGSGARMVTDFLKSRFLIGPSPYA